jgi:hypothetical protein
VSVFIPVCILSCINKDNTGVLVSCYPTHFPFRINKVFLTKNHCFCGVFEGVRMHSTTPNKGPFFFFNFFLICDVCVKGDVCGKCDVCQM